MSSKNVILSGTVKTSSDINRKNVAVRLHLSREEGAWRNFDAMDQTSAEGKFSLAAVGIDPDQVGLYISWKTAMFGKVEFLPVEIGETQQTNFVRKGISIVLDQKKQSISPENPFADLDESLSEFLHFNVIVKRRPNQRRKRASLAQCLGLQKLLLRTPIAVEARNLHSLKWAARYLEVSLSTSTGFTSCKKIAVADNPAT